MSTNPSFQNSGWEVCSSQLQSFKIYNLSFFWKVILYDIWSANLYALQDPAVTDIACAALNGLKMGDKTLTVRRATVG